MTIHLSIPPLPEGFDLGLYEGEIGVEEDLELGAVRFQLHRKNEAYTEALLDPAKTVWLIGRLFDALFKIQARSEDA